MDFSRYGDVLFEVAFAGGRLTTGANVSAEGKRLEWTILGGPLDRESIDPFVRWFQVMIRRRPFLVKNLENTLVKLLLSLEFYDDEGRQRIALALARIFSRKVGVLPDRVLPTVLVDRLVSRGTVLQFATAFFRDLIETDGVDGLLEVLRRAKLENRLLEFFPQQRRSWTEFDAHFEAAGLGELVAYNKRKLYDAHVAQLRALVAGAPAPDVAAEGDQLGLRAPGAGGAPGVAAAGSAASLEADEAAAAAADQTPGELLSEIRARAAEWKVEPADALRSAYLGLVDRALVGLAGRGQHQAAMAVLRTLKRYSGVLEALASTPRLEAGLLQTIQIGCYEEPRLLKSFRDIVKVLYDEDVIGEPAIRFWYTKGSHPKGRNVFLQDMEPFITWLDEAEEEDDSEEEDDDDESDDEQK